VSRATYSGRVAQGRRCTHDVIASRVLIAAIYAFCFLVGAWTAPALAAEAQPTDVIIDTDFGLPPIDDSFAVALVLNSHEARVLGITTVAGNQPLDTENMELRFFMERMGRTDIPLYSGGELPLSLDSRTLSGSFREKLKIGMLPARAQSDGRARIQEESASSFIARTVVRAPHQVTILAIGPLTNIALAIRQDSRVASLVKKIVVMGGYFPADSGVVLHTAPVPNAEWNFWVDPIAAKIVIESGADIEISPIDVAATVPFTEEMRRRVASGKGPFSLLVKQFMPQLDTDKDNAAGYTYFFDPLAATGIVAPHLATKAKYYVDIDVSPGLDYGASVRRSADRGKFPAGEDAGLVDVQTKIDASAFYQLIVDRLAR
jgi:inosine-uridine nucleoside N-ribohydrolase